METRFVVFVVLSSLIVVRPETWRSPLLPITARLFEYFDAKGDLGKLMASSLKSISCLVKVIADSTDVSRVVVGKLISAAYHHDASEWRKEFRELVARCDSREVHLVVLGGVKKSEEFRNVARKALQTELENSADLLDPSSMEVVAALVRDDGKGSNLRRHLARLKATAGEVGRLDVLKAREADAVLSILDKACNMDR